MNLKACSAPKEAAAVVLMSKKVLPAVVLPPPLLIWPVVLDFLSSELLLLCLLFTDSGSITWPLLLCSSCTRCYGSGWKSTFNFWAVSAFWQLSFFEDYYRFRDPSLLFLVLFLLTCLLGMLFQLMPVPGTSLTVPLELVAGMEPPYLTLIFF